MDPITLRLSKETIDDVDTEADDHDLRRAEYLRRIVENRHEHERVRDEYEATLAEYEERIAALEDERDRLQRQLAATNARQDDLGELVEYVEGEKSLRERREARASAPVWRRAWWWITGAPEADA